MQMYRMLPHWDGNVWIHALAKLSGVKVEVVSVAEQRGHRQRLKERFLAGEEQSRSDAALLELLLTYAIPQKDVRPLAEQLLATFHDLPGVLAANEGALCALDGIGEHVATLLKLTYSIGTQRLMPAPTPLEESGRVYRIAGKPHSGVNGHVVDQGERTARDTPPQSAQLFSNAVLKDAITLLPGMPLVSSMDEARAYFRSSLHFSAEETRQRYAGYIARRMFPIGKPDMELPRFARAFEGRQELRDVCFYRFCTAEPLMRRVMPAILQPAIGRGELARSTLRGYLTEWFPRSNNVVNGAKGVVDALTAAGIVRGTSQLLRFGYREIPIASLAFIVHSEFLPGMYDIGMLERNEAVRCMLWNPDRLLPSLYEMRNLGMLSKVSEIDTVRQFTVRDTLGETVERLVAAAVPA